MYTPPPHPNLLLRRLPAPPRDSRRKGDPRTPDKRLNCSKRCWDGLIRSWRRRLHAWDPPVEDMELELARVREVGMAQAEQMRAMRMGVGVGRFARCAFLRCRWV